MKKILLALVILIGLSAPSLAATCPVGFLQVKDNAGTTESVTYADDGSGSGYCIPEVLAKQLSTWSVTATLQASATTAIGKVDPNTIATWGIGTAGSPTTNVVTVQGVSGGTAQPASVASGGIASGAYASGAISDGALVTLGTKADSACGTSSGTCTEIALLKYLATTGLPVTNTSTPVTPGNGISAPTGTPPSTSSPVTAFGEAYNGSTWDALQDDANKNLKVTQYPGAAGAAGYPIGATPYTATATGTTGATTATLTGASSVTTYLCGFSIRANATAAATGNATVTGVITATMNFTQWTAPLASGLGVTEEIFNPCIPASGTNQSVAVVSAAPGSGGTVSVSAWGFKL